MVNSKTVFIIGSGASKEADLPTSDELKSKIVNKLSIQFYPEFYGDIRILDAIRHHAQNSSERKGLKYYEDAARYIKRELPAGKSIDQFLDLQRNSKMVQLCGKLAITMCILQAERDSKLYFDKDHGEKLSKTKLAHTWYIRLWQLLSTGSHAGDFHDIFDDVSFIVFNYDRCLEYFLINIIADQYDIEAIKSEDLVKKVRIYHPYGNIGDLPELTTLNSISIKFGDVDLKGSELIQLAQNIKTFTESRNDTMEFSAMQNDLNNCETLVFLGFGFHEINLKLLKFNERSKIRRIFGTTRGLSQDNKLYLEKYFRGIFNNQFGNDMMKLDKIDCWELFDNYSFSLGK